MKNTSMEVFDRWLKKPEDCHIEFKEAKSRWGDKHSIDEYCAALANEGGGMLILGVNDKHQVVGTTAFSGTHQKEPNKLLNALGIRVEVEEFNHPKGRVLIFHAPSHYPGKPVKFKGIYWMRAGESLTQMDEHTLRAKLNEGQPDFTASVVPGLAVSDLNPQAVENLKKKWAKESNRGDFVGFDAEKALKNLGLVTKEGVSYAALILAGQSEAIARYLPDSEIIFEWRHNHKQTHYDFRKNWRGAFVNIDDEIWDTINARNIRIPFQEGLFQREVWGFDEKSVREAVHNAVMHRDYSIKGQSIFIKASPQEFYIESPGGFPPGITLENILYEKRWRNRKLAEAFEKIGFAERSSQGLDDIFEQSIRDGKGLPDLSKSDASSVRLSIPAQVKDKDFILYLERIMKERQLSLSFDEIYELEKIREQQKIEHTEFKNKFIELGLVEPIGRGRGTKYILSRHYYETLGQSGKHTRLKGLSRNQMKELILNHIKEGKPARRLDFISGFPECNPQDVSNMLQELRREGKIAHEGSKIKGSWKVKENK